MFKVVWLLKRKEGMTHAEFREHFENSHAPIARKHIAHLFSEYRRNYPNETWSGGDPRKAGSNFGPKEWEYDCISEWIFPNEDAFNELNRIMAEPAVSQEFFEDEEKFLDRDGFVMIKCEVVE